MTKNEMGEDAESQFSLVLTSAAKLPGVRINRDAYLRKALARYCSDEDIHIAVAKTPAAAGISLDVLNRAANDSIKYETLKVTALSFLAGMPGWFAMIGTVPADLAQHFGHILRIAQKLAYLYSWPELFSSDGDEPDDATKGMLTLFVGVMVGAQSANTAVAKVSQRLSRL